MADLSTRTVNTQGARTVTALMAITVAFALLGSEIKNATGQNTGSAKATNGVTEGGKIILGGLFGTSVLILLTHAGEGGREFAVGLAVVTMTTATLVYGGPVWDAINNIIGGTSTTGTTSTTPTTPTTPSGNTAQSVATVATAAVA